jgi:undecaprenyl-diphosphatase
MSLWSRILRLDAFLSAQIARATARKGAHILAQILAHSADSPVCLLLAFGALALGGPRVQTMGWRTLAATLGAGVVVTALKSVFRRPRPPGRAMGVYLRFDRHAFPSGHAGRTACLTTMLAPLLPPAASAALVAWTLGVGISRVMLEVHFLSDVTVGWLTGFLVGQGLLLFL